ncbi:hypothetical protein JB92DRAFT_3097346 [Gautieria morchelliformis]|nr:hypothetical protein JB92DRAFT_3097346 [Gautieria morchelliformis]
MFTFTNTLMASLDSWLSRLKYWLRPVHSFESQGDISHIEQTSCGTTFNPAVLSSPSPPSIDLPSSTIYLSFDIDPESLEIGSEPSSTASSRCHTPLEDYPYADNKALRHTTGLSISKTNSKVLSTNSTTTPSARRYTLLGEYSLQELVLLEFITHTSDVQPADIDDILLRYPPGFSQYSLESTCTKGRKIVIFVRTGQNELTLSEIQDFDGDASVQRALIGMCFAAIDEAAGLRFVPGCVCPAQDGESLW